MIGGPCAGGAAYSPALGDLTIMAGPDARMFLTGPAVVERVTREQVTAAGARRPEGPRRATASRTCVADGRRRTRPSSSARRWRTCPSQAGGALPLYPPRDPRRGDPGRRPARARAARSTTCATSPRGSSTAASCSSSAPRWARNLVVGFARIEGAPVGVIANQPHHLGGCLDAESSQKGAWFVDLCDRFGAAARRARRHARASCPGVDAGAGRASSATARRCCGRSAPPPCRA